MTPEQVAARVLGPVRERGLDPALAAQLMVTPACGLAGHTSGSALRALRTVSKAAEIVTDQLSTPDPVSLPPAILHICMCSPCICAFCAYAGGREHPEHVRRIIVPGLAGAQDSLSRVDPDRPAEAIAHLQEAARNVNLALNEAMAAGVVAGGLSVRQAAQASGLAPNTLPARLAATSLLASYSGPDRRVRSEGIARARHDMAQRAEDQGTAAQPTKTQHTETQHTQTRGDQPA